MLDEIKVLISDINNSDNFDLDFITRSRNISEEILPSIFSENPSIVQEYLNLIRLIANQDRARIGNSNATRIMDIYRTISENSDQMINDSREAEVFYKLFLDESHNFDAIS